MSLDKETMMKNALIAEMIIGANPMDVELDYNENWNSLIDACKAVSVIKGVTDRHSNDIEQNLLSFNKEGLFNSLVALAEWLKWRDNISLSRKPEVEKK
jgi:hypothetical protein